MSQREIWSISTALALVGTVAAVLTVPEFRVWLHLDSPPLEQEVAPLPASPIPARVEQLSGEYHGEVGLLDPPVSNKSALSISVLPSGDLTGTVVPMNGITGGQAPTVPIAGKISGDRIRFTANLDSTEATGTMTFYGKITDDSISGKISMQIHEVKGIDINQAGPQEKLEASQHMQELERKLFWTYKR